MVNGKKKIQNKIGILIIVAMLICLVPAPSASANTVNWSVYYASGGGNKLDNNVTVYTSGGGYRAKCSQISGNCIDKRATITSISTEYHLNKTVAFTQTGTVDFKTRETPSTTYIFFRASLTYSGGNSASFAGTIEGR